MDRLWRDRHRSRVARARRGAVRRDRLGAAGGAARGGTAAAARRRRAGGRAVAAVAADVAAVARGRAAALRYDLRMNAPVAPSAVIADDERLMREQMRARLAEVWPE